MSTVVATLVLVQQDITRYVLSTIIALGNMGNLFLIAIYLQKKHRTSSCSIYLRASSIFCLISANWAIIPLLYALNNPDPLAYSLTLCRMRGYFIHTASMCFRYTLVLVCADRYALCNTSASVRALSRPAIAYRSIAFITVFWYVASLHLAILEDIQNGRCGVFGVYGQVFSWYILVFTGIVPIGLMSTFGILLAKNLRAVRSRVGPGNTNANLKKRDISLLKLVLMEVAVYIVCTITHPFVVIYTQATASVAASKSADRKQIESFINFITMSLLLYLNYNTTFYVHLTTSKAFRNEVKQFVRKCIGKLNRNTQKNENRMTTASNLQKRTQQQ